MSGSDNTSSLTDSHMEGGEDQSHESYVWSSLDSTLIWIKVDDQIFCLPFRILTHGVEGLHGILLAAIQSGSENSKDDPCVMPSQIHASDWKAWVQYRNSYGPFRSSTFTQGSQFWEGVLDIASFFMDDVGRQAAIAHLSSGPSECRSARKVFLGRKYQILEWLAPAFRSLIQMNPHDLTPDDIRDLDTNNHQTYLKITCIRHDITRWQREKLLRPPSATHEDANCSSGRRARCEQAWVTHYRLSLIPLNHPTDDISAERVLARMEKDSGPEQMGIGCWTNSVAELRHFTSFTTHCNSIIEEGVASLVAI